MRLDLNKRADAIMDRRVAMAEYKHVEERIDVLRKYGL